MMVTQRKSNRKGVIPTQINIKSTCKSGQNHVCEKRRSRGGDIGALLFGLFVWFPVAARLTLLVMSWQDQGSLGEAAFICISSIFWDKGYYCVEAFVDLEAWVSSWVKGIIDTTMMVPRLLSQTMTVLSWISRWRKTDWRSIKSR